MQLATVRLRRKLEASVREDASTQEVFDQVVKRELDPASAAARLLDREL
jgi:LAO/AO transport system kinase